MRRGQRDATVRVLVDVPVANWRKNPYVHGLVAEPAPGVELLGFDRRTALLSRYDVVHSHWPEHRVWSRHQRRRWRQRLWWLLWMLRLHVQRVPVVRTRHNRDTHEALPAVDRWLLGLLERRTRGEIWLSDLTRAESGAPDDATHVVIPHPDLAPWVRMAKIDLSSPRPTEPPHAVASIGYLRRYKNFGEGIDVVSGCADFTLVVAGDPADAAYADELTAQAATTANVRVVAERLRNVELMRLLRASQAVLLPYVDLYNSGVVFLALALGRPVILRDGPVARDLREEFGADWIGTYSGRLTPDGLRSAWQQTAAARGVPVGSAERRPERVTQAHADLYRQVSRRHHG